jgi:diacylglycerol kinase family enzyme
MAAIAVILNGSSGRGDCAPAAKRLEEIFAAAGREARISVARGGDEIRAAMRQAVDSGCETLVAGGGDGTINTAAQLLLGSEVRLGVIPLGTLNHFAKDLGIPLELDAAAQVILDGTECRVDTGEVNGRVFLNNSSLGVYPVIVRLRERYQASGLGKWIAALWATLAVMRLNLFLAVRITAEGESIVRRTPFVFVGNNEYRMSGLQAASRESVSAGHLALYVFNAERRRSLLGLAWRVLVHGADEVQELDLLTVEEATVETRRRRLQVALDGEVLVLESPLRYRIRPASLWVHVLPQSTTCDPMPSGSSSIR